ncbi:uncharacterized protein LOC134249587 [Saccostrea cucullata]|uniref:uncharacterized protein LOC134249587 n=1 Tax=Saccostrea cuccullata TaxID=36930 RepID=UPI002ED25343
MNKTRITSSLYPARRQDLYVKHDTDTWIAVSCSLIGSFVTLILIGCLLYFRSRSKLKMKHPKRIGRILSTSTEAGRNLQLPEGHFELSALTPESQCEDDDTYAEIRVSQIDGACAASCMDTISKNEKCCKISKEPNRKRNTNLYEKCSFETEYDQINLKMKSSLSPSLHNERKVITVKDQGIDVLSSQKKIEVHDESFTSLILPPSLKRFRTKENNQFKPHSSSLHHSVSENEFYKQDRKDEEENYAELNQAKHMTISGPNVKEEEDRPYSVVYLSSYNDLNSKDRVRPGKGSHSNAKSEENVLKSESNQAKHIAASDPNVKEEEDRPYSVVHLSSYNDVNSKERMRPGIGFHSNAKPKENVLKPELNQAEHIAASDPNVKEDEDRPYSVVHLSSYNDLNSKERVKPGTGFPSNAKPEEKVLKPEIGEVKHMAASDPNEKVQDRPYSVVHLSLYDDVNSKEREKPGKNFSGNAKQEEKELSKQEVPE